jgi:hypothetical protein
MVVQQAELVVELRTLRKGRGICATQVGDRVGTALRQLSGVTPEDGASQLRHKVASLLQEYAAALPEDLRIAVLAGLALHPEVRLLPFYGDRIRWVADRLGRDERTVQRRVDEGIRRLAELMLGLGTAGDRLDLDLPGPGWRVAELRTIVLLDQPVREAIEQRRIVAERDGLDRLEMGYSLPRDPAAGPDPDRELRIDVLYGGMLVRRQMESSERIGLVLQLPRRLERGEAHEYGMRIQVPKQRRIQPHFVCIPGIPKVSIDGFNLRIRFDRDLLPKQVWRLDGAYQRDVDDPVPIGEPVSPDITGEVQVRFRNLAPGLAYGLRWLDDVVIPRAPGGLAAH